MTPLRIREAHMADDHGVGRLLVRAFEAQYARQAPPVAMWPERRAYLEDQAGRRAVSTVLVAERGDDLLGTVALFPWGSPGSEAWIAGAANLRLLAVDAAFQGQGLSGLLLEAAERLGEAWAAPAVCLHVRRGVGKVARLYEARGYAREPAGDLDRLPRLFLEAYALALPRL